MQGLISSVIIIKKIYIYPLSHSYLNFNCTNPLPLKFMTGPRDNGGHLCTCFGIYLANFFYGRVLAKVLSHVTIIPVLLRPVNNFLGQVIGNASEGNTILSSTLHPGEVTFQKCLNNTGITLFSSKYNN